MSLVGSGGRRPIYLDCDTGIDDSIALAYLLASPEVELVGIGTVSGNVSAARAARNTLDLLHLAGRDDVPVAIGAQDFLAGSFDGGVPWIHGHNGVGDVMLPAAPREPDRRDAADLLRDLAHEHGGALSIVTVGPTTNIATALAREPGLPGLIRSVTTMGGAALAPGNISAVAEANIGNDPEAAAALLDAGWDCTLVPLDVTLENRLFERDCAALLDAPTALVRALGAMLDIYFDYYVPLYGERSCALHDPMAAAIAVGEVRSRRAPAVEIVVDTTRGPGRGQTICDLRGQRLGPVDQPGARTRVVLELDRPLGPHLVERLTRFDAPEAVR
ncbi:nucleoside hydrolase [Sphingomonas oleivorans]|uniref:Nucleoside hydrolase n=1 Tax=Sphingomonas oleivorans TaxID=1735121 RepID=A0A2T5FZF4_9SPHN|nr:nucleoside hydrolase [Sphingomonas oleivorans]PTQ12084.1 nucleoside hydrolase [Sphingomonas oleivorans]